MTEIEKAYEDFWKEIVEDDGGNLVKDYVMRELYDFKMVMDNVSRVYDSLTCGKISKPNTEAGAVIAVVNDTFNEAQNRASFVEGITRHMR